MQRDKVSLLCCGCRVKAGRCTSRCLQLVLPPISKGPGFDMSGIELRCRRRRSAVGWRGGSPCACASGGKPCR